MKHLNNMTKEIIPVVNKVRIIGILLLSFIFISATAIADGYHHYHHSPAATLVSMGGHAGHGEGNGHEAHGGGSSKSEPDSNKVV